MRPHTDVMFVRRWRDNMNTFKLGIHSRPIAILRRVTYDNNACLRTRQLLKLHVVHCRRIIDPRANICRRNDMSHYGVNVTLRTFESARCNIAAQYRGIPFIKRKQTRFTWHRVSLRAALYIAARYFRTGTRNARTRKRGSRATVGNGKDVVSTLNRSLATIRLQRG